MSTHYTNYTQTVNMAVPIRVKDEVVTPNGRGFVTEVNPMFGIISVNHGDGNGSFMYTDDQVQLYVPPVQPVSWNAKCECGATFTVNPNCHSRWCPKYKE